MTKRTFEITVKSPYGSQAIESFKHHIVKIADEAKERWGIEIHIEEQGEDIEAEFE